MTPFLASFAVSAEQSRTAPWWWSRLCMVGVSSPRTSSEALFFSFFLNPHPRTLFSFEREGEKHRHESSIRWLRPVCARPRVVGAWCRDQTRNFGMFPNGESNPKPFGYGTTL